MDKPVAHFYPEGEGCTVYDIQFAWRVTGTTEPIPLYDRPIKTLTRDEILSLWDWDSGEILATDILDFADFYKRALLGEEGLVKK